MTQHNALVLVGSGPGIGRNTAAVFAAKGFSHVVLLSRNASRLAEDAEFVRKAAPSPSAVRVDTVTVDLTDVASVRKALGDVERKLEESRVPLEAVLYNAARVGISKFGEWKVEDLDTDLKIAVMSMYVVATWAIPRLTRLAAEAKNGSGSSNSGIRTAFLATSGLLWSEPFPHLFSLSACKAAQHNMMDSLRQQFAPCGVHVGMVVVGGSVSDSAKLTTAANVAEEMWKFYSQEEGKWTLDVTMNDPDYEAEMKKALEKSGVIA